MEITSVLSFSSKIVRGLSFANNSKNNNNNKNIFQTGVSLARAGFSSVAEVNGFPAGDISVNL